MSHTLTEGGQITSHRLRMFKQVIKLSLFISLVIGACIFAILMYSVPFVAYQAVWYYAKALAMQGIVKDIEISREFLFQAMHVQYQHNPSLPIEHVIKLTSPIAQKLLNEGYARLVQSLIASGICASLILAFFFYRGVISKTKKHLSGSKIVSATWINLRLKFRRKSSNIKVGPIHLVKGTETQHMMITGGTGSGKTNCLHHILGHIRSNKHKAIIVDSTGVFLDRYYREGKDILLNPLDSRGVAWHPWAEGETAIDYANLADSFISSSNSENENYWRMASKTVLVSLLEKFSDVKKTSELTRWIQYETLDNLCKLVRGTKAAAHMDLSSEKTASSIRSVASTFMECLETLPDTSTPFSIKDWVAKKDDSWLFIQCQPSQRTLMKPLMTAWISSAIRGLLALPVDLDRRIWFSMDELPSLQKVKDLDTLLTEGRKYGGCGIITLQSPAQLENIYGREVSKIIIGNTATKVIFRERDPEIAERISKAFGDREVLEIQEGITYGAHEARDGVSLSMQNKTRPVVSATQILELPINTAYIKLADEKYVASITIPLSVR